MESNLTSKHLLQRLIQRIPSSVTPSTRIEVHPSELLDLAERLADETGTGLDAEFHAALDACGIKEPLEVYTSNSYRRVGIKGQYRELIYAYNQKSDGHPDIHGTKLLEAMVAAFNAMLAHRLPPETVPPPSEQLVCRKCGSSDVMPWPTTQNGG